MMSSKFFIGSLVCIGLMLLSIMFTIDRLGNGKDGLVIILLIISIFVFLILANLFYVIGIDEKKREGK